MTVLVTGGAGFIGTNFIQYERNAHPKDRIICLDKLTYAGRKENLHQWIDGDTLCFVEGDIADTAVVDQVFETYEPDYVINFAAESHVDRSITSPELFLKTNIIGTGVLLEACKKYGIKRFHQVSTDEVYGELPLDRKDLLFTEEWSLKPSSPYSASKASADLLVLAYHRTFGVPVTISRCSNNYGPYQFPEKLIPVIISNVTEERQVPIYGTGENVRDWIYVTDHCAAIDQIVRRGRDGQIYNVGGNTEKTNLEVVRLILKEFGQKEDRITFVTDRPGHDLRYAMDASKLYRELQVKPTVTFEQGIQKTITWYKENEKWVEMSKARS